MVIKREGGALYFQKVNGCWFIESVYVNPSLRGHGIGTALMQDALDRIGRPVLIFATSELGGDMKRLRKFYKDFGFKPIRQRKYDTFPYNYNMILED